jgi:vitamin B12 transporter
VQPQRRAGNFTAVRCAEPRRALLVLIDGVRVADPPRPAAGSTFGNLLMGNLGRIELQRSSNSTIWGSQASAAVSLATTGAAQGSSASARYGAT